MIYVKNNFYNFYQAGQYNKDQFSFLKLIRKNAEILGHNDIWLFGFQYALLVLAVEKHDTFRLSLNAFY